MAVDPESGIEQKLKTAIDIAPISGETAPVVDKLSNELDNKLIDDSRPPRLFILGRSGAGKSSLINALANKEVADVGAVKPKTVDSEKYHIQFPDRHANWDVVDSRGLFESVSAGEELPEGTVEKLKQDIEQYKPDIAIHVLTPDQARAGEQDFDTIEDLRESIPAFPPVVYCLNKVDQHQSPGNSWPPEENPNLSSTITENLDFVAKIQNNSTRQPFDQNSPVRGYQFYSDDDLEQQDAESAERLDDIGVFPTYLKEEPYWNVNTLSKLIGDRLPDEAMLQFAQAQRRQVLMRRLARRRIIAYSSVGGSIAGADLTAVSDIMLLTPLQVHLVMQIGAFSCREFSKETAMDYFTELGMVGGAGLALRRVAGSAVGVIPGPGQAINTAIAGGGTYAIGRSAEKYFFDGESVSPSTFIEDGKKIIGG